MEKAKSLAHDLPPHGRRFSAFLIDRFLLSFFFFPVFVASLMTAMGFIVDSKFFPLMPVTALLILCWTLSFAFRVLCYCFFGATPGKYLNGLRLVPRNERHDGSGEGQRHGLSASQCMIQVLADDLAFFFAFAPAALLFFRLDRTHLSNWIAETRVVSIKAETFMPVRRPLWGSFLLILGLLVGTQSR